MKKRKKTFLKEETDSSNMLSVADAIEKYVEHIDSLSEDEKNKIKTNLGKDSDNDYIELAKVYIEKYKEEQTKPDTKTLIKEKGINLKELLRKFSNSINSVIDEKTYEKEFNPIFSKVGIQPISISTPSDSKEAATATGLGATAGSSSLFANPAWDEWKSKDYFGQEKEKASSPVSAPSSSTQPTSEPSTMKQDVPKIKFGDSMETAYVDMGGGRYAPASEDQLGDPSVQLYVKNPRKGQGEYLKPNYIKVRREGGELRRQSQFGGALGSLSNFLGDVGDSAKKL